MLLRVPGLDIQHHPVGDGHEGFRLREVQTAVGVQQGAQTPFLRQGQQPGEKFRVEGALPAGDGDAPDKGHILLHLRHHLLRCQLPDSGGGTVGAMAEAFVAEDAFGDVVDHPALFLPQRPGGAMGQAGAAVDTGVDGLRVVAVFAVEVAAL